MPKPTTSRTLALAQKLIFEVFRILKEQGGELQGKQVLQKVSQRVPLDDWAKEQYEKSGYIRWESITHFYSIDCMKAGWLLKKNGIWYLTPEGERAIALGEDHLLTKARELYKIWKRNRTVVLDTGHEIPEEEAELSPSQVQTIDQYESAALEGLKSYVDSLNPYEFQDLVAALLRGMGYYTPFVAPKGKDGGVDIIAYRDPLGTVTPRIKVQVKHREVKATVAELRQLMGLLQKDGDVGIFISTGGFTPDTKTTAQSSHVHVELIDFDRFIGLWKDFYEKMPDEDKKRLPLTPIYFLAT